jgi:hypothetical protein
MTTQPRPRGPIVPMPITRRGKILFALGLTAWFLLLMMPCALFWLASGGEIHLEHASIPESALHPFLKIGTVMNRDARGFQITTSYVANQTDDAMCVQTNVSYALWQSRGENPNTSFCDCYTHTEDQWQSTSTTSGACP